MNAVATPERQASGSSFYTAMRLLPPPERAAIFAVYGFCRLVDDIVDDGDAPPAERRADLDAWRADLAALYAGAPPERAAYLAEPVRRFGLAQGDFLAVVDGMEMDVGEPIRAPDFATFDLYCDRVASAVGRLSTRIFGMNDDPGRTLAHHLGRALQFTNVLRDLDEDAGMGRLYLPADALAEGAITTTDPAAVIADPGIDAACRWLAARAHTHYREADRILQARPPGKLRTPRLMSAIYADILRRMEATGWQAPRTRAKVGKAKLLWTLLRHGLME